jgi:trimethylamine--corrinoid protein Co-methyltransferase
LINEFIGGNYRVLSSDDVYRVHLSSLEILERIGIAARDPSTLDLMRKAGALVDYGKKVIRIPEYLVKEAVKKAPSVVRLCARNPKFDLRLEGCRVHFGTGGTALYVLDLKEGVRRKATKKDIEDLGRLTDALNNIHFFHLPVFPSDVPMEAANIYRFYCGLTNVTKHVTGSGYTTRDIDEAIRMASIIAGGYDELIKRPLTSFIVCPVISPLTLDANVTNLLIHIAKTSLPLIVSVEVVSGTTGPVTLAGTLAQQNAETLCGILISQIVNPGTPVLYGNVSSISDPWRGHFLSGAVELGLLSAASTQMAHYYGLPIYATAGMSDSKIPDAQAGYEKAATTMLVALAGGNFIHDAAGLLEFSLTASYEQMVIDDEILGMTLRAVKGIDVNDENLALDVIEKVGPGGNYLVQQHTCRHLRDEHYIPTLSDRRRREDWEIDGSRDTWMRAREIAQLILEKHIVEPLPKEISLELENALKTALKNAISPA